MCLASAACSSSVLESIPEPGEQHSNTDPRPNIKTSAAEIKRIAAEAKLSEPLQVAGPLAADPMTVAPWIICVRGKVNDPAQPTYALFYRDLKLVASKPSAIVDRCDTQTFAPL
jgi:hypothetical protein